MHNYVLASWSPLKHKPSKKPGIAQDNIWLQKARQLRARRMRRLRAAVIRKHLGFPV